MQRDPGLGIMKILDIWVVLCYHILDVHKSDHFHPVAQVSEYWKLNVANSPIPVNTVAGRGNQAGGSRVSIRLHWIILGTRVFQGISFSPGWNREVFWLLKRTSQNRIATTLALLAKEPDLFVQIAYLHLFCPSLKLQDLLLKLLAICAWCMRFEVFGAALPAGTCSHICIGHDLVSYLLGSKEAKGNELKILAT